jgi:hypothetical protein
MKCGNRGVNCFNGRYSADEVARIRKKEILLLLPESKSYERERIMQVILSQGKGEGGACFLRSPYSHDT